jgi:hypothetical protein
VKLREVEVRRRGTNTVAHAAAFIVVEELPDHLLDKFQTTLVAP